MEQHIALSAGAQEATSGGALMYTSAVVFGTRRSLLSYVDRRRNGVEGQ